LARESLRYRAVEYLLKNNLDRDMLMTALKRAAHEREQRLKLRRAGNGSDIKTASLTIAVLLQSFLEGSNSGGQQVEKVLSEKGLLEHFAFTVIKLSYGLIQSNLQGFLDQNELQKIIEWQKEITHNIGRSLFKNFIVLEMDKNTILGFTWDIAETEWDNSLALFEEQLVKTSAKITRVSLEIMPSLWYADIKCGENPAAVFRRLSSSFDSEKLRGHTDRVDRARKYVLDHLAEQITLEDVSEYACLSPGYLSSLFKKEFGQSLIEFINTAKVNRACVLIREGKHRIKEISDMLGIENTYYFSRLFKQFTGLTPSAYKAKTQDNSYEEENTHEHNVTT
jgi:YesN/AraC family two-component response regulator